MQVELVPYGAAIQAIRLPMGTRDVNVVLGYESAHQYAVNPHYLGTTVGRYAGRINAGRFPLNGQDVQISSGAASGGHCLHGGPDGLHARLWAMEPRLNESSALLRTQSLAGESGFPGNLDLEVRYTLANTTLTIEYTGVSDADTVLNLTNHSYFNLNGGGLIDGQYVTIHADAYTPVDQEGIPTGEIKAVNGTEFDLREPLRMQVSQARRSTVYDNNFVLQKTGSPRIVVNGLEASLAVTATSADKHVVLNVYTSQPGLQFYTGQFLDANFAPFSGMCFEAQGFPDAPNQPGFPSTLLRAGETYRQVIIFQFETAAGPA